jgi:hypothetical protein
MNERNNKLNFDAVHQKTKQNVIRPPLKENSRQKVFIQEIDKEMKEKLTDNGSVLICPIPFHISCYFVQRHNSYSFS